MSGAEPLTLGTVASAMVRAAASAVVETESAAVADEPDGVHQHRTRVRRLRSILAALRPELDAEAVRALRLAYREWGRQLGTVRDAEVLAAEASTALERLGIEDDDVRRRLVDEPLARYSGLHARLVELHAGPRTAARTRDLRAFAGDPPVGDPEADAGGALRAILRHEARRVRRAAARTDGTLGSLHDVRKAGRRLRYVAEAIGEHGPEDLRDSAAALADAGSRLHDVLGDLRDALALADRLERERTQAARDGEPVDAYDRLIADAEERADRQLRHLGKALKRVKRAASALD